MEYSFNLVDKPWIPCLTRGGEAVQLSLADVFSRIDDLAEIGDPSPLVTAALYRLLLTLVHRCHGPASQRELEDMWDRPLDTQPILDYLGIWRHRFDLFDTVRPFYQTPDLPHGAVTVAKLAPELSSGNNPTLFDHTHDKTGTSIVPAAAARLVLACQAFDLGGLISRVSGESPSAMAAPSAAGAVILFMGDTLADTLRLNLVPYNTTSPWNVRSIKLDAPAWEQDQLPQAATRRPLGYLDYLTWQSRRIWLQPASKEGQTVVEHAVRAAGWRLDQPVSDLDPHMAYRANQAKNPKPDDPAYFALRLRSDRAVWRDSTAILGPEADTHKPPLTRRSISELVAGGALSRAARCRLAVLGMVSDRAKMHLWRHERMSPPLSLVADEGAVTDSLGDLLHLAEQTAWRLSGALSSAGERLKRRESDPHHTTISSGQLAFWASLESQFQRLLDDLTTDLVVARKDWARAVRRSALDAFDHGARSLQGVSYIREVTEARAALEGWLNSKIRTYMDPEEGSNGGEESSVRPVS